MRKRASGAIVVSDGEDEGLGGERGGWVAGESRRRLISCVHMWARGEGNVGGNSARDEGVGEVEVGEEVGTGKGSSVLEGVEKKLMRVAMNQWECGTDVCFGTSRVVKCCDVLRLREVTE